MRTHFCSTTRLTLLIVMIGLTLGSLLSRAAWAAGSEDRIGGTMRAVIDGRAIHFPSLKSDISADINGDLATVTIVQTFINPSRVPLNASYLFPLNKDSAVYFMQIEVGDERIVSVIKKTPEARASFEQAKREGKAAALLTQHRPNMFIQELANLMPGQSVKVTLKYSQVVPRIDGSYELVVPLVVGPRYMPEERSVETVSVTSRGAQSEQRSGEWQFSKAPAYPNVGGLDIPDTIDKERVAIEIALQAGFPIKDIESRTHALTVEGEDLTRTVHLASGRTTDNRDFVLRYKLAGRELEAGLIVHRDERGDFVSLLIEPPETPVDDDITPREMVFVLDTSGSMTGLPIEASKTFMRQALQSLRSTDTFRIIHFANNASEFTSEPVPATAFNKTAGTRYVDGLRAGGGTEVMSGIEQAFAVKPQAGTLRIVTFLTDGYIGNEAQTLRLISTHQNDARIYAFGVGTSVNRYLLAEMARMGRGYARFIDPTEDGHAAAADLAKRLESPLLTDISVDWGTLNAEHITPVIAPDLFKGDSLRFLAKASKPLEPGSTHTVKVKGLVNGRAATLPLQVKVSDSLNGKASDALPLIWARTRIADDMRDLTRPQHTHAGGLSNEQLQARVTALGLNFSLMTQWTSFVAVSEKVVNSTPGATAESQVPLNQVEGVSEHAYDKKINTAPAQEAPIYAPRLKRRTYAVNTHGPSSSNFNTFSGGSTPEPGIYGGLLILSLMGLAGLLRRRKQQI